MYENQPMRAPTKEQANWGMACHLAAFAAFIFPALGNIIGVLIVWLIKKDEMEFVYDQGIESLNFQITVFILGIISWILIFVVIGIFLLVALCVFWLIVTIIASVKASNGEAYRYPLNFRFIR